MPVVSDEHRSEVRSRILAAAVQHVREHGVRATTTRAVQDAAGVSAGTIYNYFPNAAALTAAASERIALEDWDGVVSALDLSDNDGLRELVQTLVVDTVDAQSERRQSTLLRLDAEPESDAADAVTSYNRFVVSTIAPTVVDAQRSGQINDAVDADALVELLDMIRDAMSIRAGQDTYVTSHERVGAALLDVLERGISI